MNLKLIMLSLLIFSNLHSSDAKPVATHSEVALNQLDPKAIRHQMFVSARTGKTKELETAFMQLDSINHTQAVEFLKTNQDLLPLAISSCNPETVMWLLEQKCNTSLLNYHNQTPQQHAQNLINKLKAELANSKENMEQLRKKFNISKTDLTNSDDQDHQRRTNKIENTIKNLTTILSFLSK